MRRLAVRPAGQRGDDPHPDDQPVRPHDAGVHALGVGLAAQQPHPALQDLGQVVGVDEVGERAGLDQEVTEVEELAQRGVGREHAPVERDDGDADRRVLDHGEPQVGRTRAGGHARRYGGGTWAGRRDERTRRCRRTRARRRAERGRRYRRTRARRRDERGRRHGGQSLRQPGDEPGRELVEGGLQSPDALGAGHAEGGGRRGPQEAQARGEHTGGSGGRRAAQPRLDERDPELLRGVGREGLGTQDAAQPAQDRRQPKLEGRHGLGVRGGRFCRPPARQSVEGVRIDRVARKVRAAPGSPPHRRRLRRRWTARCAHGATSRRRCGHGARPRRSVRRALSLRHHKGGHPLARRAWHLPVT